MTATLPGRQWPVPSKPSKAGQQHGGAERGVQDVASLALLADVTWHGSKAGPLELPPVQARPAIRARRTLDYGGLAVVECDKRHTHSMEQGIGPVRRNLFRQHARKRAVFASGSQCEGLLPRTTRKLSMASAFIRPAGHSCRTHRAPSGGREKPTPSRLGSPPVCAAHGPRELPRISAAD